MKSRYNNYSSAVMEEKQQLTEWLSKKRYKKETLKTISNYAAHYLHWLENERITAPKARYQDVIAYLSYQRKNGDSENLASNRIAAVRKYYHYLQYENNEQTNPAENLFIKQHKKQLVHDILTKEQLYHMYQEYSNQSLRQKRNKVILGILIHQALRKEEITLLKAHHLQLREGKLIVPPNNANNGRTLTLASDQVLDLQEYVLVVRPQIIKEMKHSKVYGRKPSLQHQSATIDQLFISMNGSLEMKASLYHLIKELKKSYEELKGVQQIRMSVITHWLKEKDIREVQYMAGFRYLDSLGYYQKYHTDELETALKKYHPLK